MEEVRREIAGSKSPSYERKHHVFLKEPKRTVLVVGGLAKQNTSAPNLSETSVLPSPPTQELNKWPPDEFLLDLIANNILMFRMTICLSDPSPIIVYPCQ